MALLLSPGWRQSEDWASATTAEGSQAEASVPGMASAIPVDYSTVHSQVQVAARRMSMAPRASREAARRMSMAPHASTLLDTAVSATDADAEDEATFQLWEDKRHMTSFLMSSLQRDTDSMLVLEFTANNTSYMRPGLSRFDLLRECRKSVPDSALQPGSVQQNRQYRGAVLQLRDIRALQDAHRPSLMVRLGAIVVTIDPLSAIITHDRAFVMVPDGADSLLEPLLKRVGHGHSDVHTQNIGFEFMALESLLVTLVSHHQQEVQRCEEDAAVILKAIRKQVSSKLLNKILLLKRSVHTVFQKVHGAQAALEELQQDPHEMSHMFLSRNCVQEHTPAWAHATADTHDAASRPHTVSGGSEARALGSSAGNNVYNTSGSSTDSVPRTLLSPPPAEGHTKEATKKASTGAEGSAAQGEGEAGGGVGWKRAEAGGEGGMGSGSQVGYYDTMHVEILLDAYALKFAGLTSALSLLEQEIDATEDFLQLKLDSSRNKLIRLDVLFGIVSTWFAFSQCISGYYGMNIPHGMSILVGLFCSLIGLFIGLF
jgi:hypothetical protein